jgi:polyisoprenoid-binding protein YceI
MGRNTMFRVVEMHLCEEQATSGAVRSPFAPVVVPISALIAALVRWQMQGSRNVYTAISKRFYIPDPDFGWQISTRHPIWLGLEICAVIAGVAVALVIGGWIIRRREVQTHRRATVLRAASWLVGGITLAAPIAAFASGGAPAGAADTLPESTLRGIAAGITGTLDAPAGRYEVVDHPGSSITAHLSAGHETFDARFEHGIRGRWQGDPHDLTQPISGELSVDAAGVDTGIDERSQHARESYLVADKHPRITVSLDKVIAATQTGPGSVGFRAHGTLGFVGKTHSIEVAGTLRKPDPASLARLGVQGDVLLVQADFEIVIKETTLASDAGDFDGDRIPIHISLVMRRTSG